MHVFAVCRETKELLWQSKTNALQRAKRLCMRRIQCRAVPTFYLFFPMSKIGCHVVTFRLGAAAIILIFSFLGFLASRLPL